MIDVKVSLDAFLDSGKPGVIAIKGDWGAGKTYFIRHYLRSRNNIKQKPVSFVSLFGLSSVDTVRRQIVPSALSARAFREGKNHSTVQTLMKFGRKLPKLSEFEEVFQSVEDQLTRELLVVFDDVERKDKDLSLKAFLGLVNYLSEHADCQVIVILNEDQLEEADRVELNKFREKLLDREILFAPSYEENARLFFHDKDLFEQALKTFVNCDCRNLRIIKKCYDNSALFNRHFSGLPTETREALLSQVVLLSCLFYQYGSEIDFDSIGDLRMSIFRGREDADDTSGEKILKRVNFWQSDFDKIIVHYLKTGLFDSELAAAINSNTEQTTKREEIRRQMRSIYRIFNGNFRGTVGDFTGQLSSFVNKNLQELSWPEIDEAARFLRSLDRSQDSENWTDDFIRLHAEKFSLSDCQSFMPRATSGEAKRALEARRTAILGGRHPREIIYKMVRQQGWNPEDTAALNALDSDFYHNWFLTEEDPDFLPMLREFIGSFNPNSSEAEWREIGNKVFTAFRKLASKNEFIRTKLVKVLQIPATTLDSRASHGDEGQQ